jgi:succinate dehydrogenase / fumarate reductase flavoprotein subunit
MNDLVGLIRTASELTDALERIAALSERSERLTVEGDHRFNPGWHLAIDLRNMLLVSECIARAALERKESRGGHTRDDYPMTDPEWGKINLAVRLEDNKITVTQQPLLEMPAELKQFFEEK